MSNLQTNDAASNECNPRFRLERGYNAAKAGDFELALQDYIWFHHHALQYERGFYGVRLSYALDHWMNLATDYPPALVALKQIRDQKIETMRGGTNDYALFHDIQSINESLDSENLTYQLFLVLHQRDQVFAAECFDLAANAIVSAKDYSLAERYFVEPETVLYKKIAEINECSGYGKVLPKDQFYFGWDGLVAIYGRTIGNLLVVLSSAGRYDEVRYAIEWSLAMIEDKTIRGLMQEQLLSGFDPEGKWKLP